MVEDLQEGSERGYNCSVQIGSGRVCYATGYTRGWHGEMVTPAVGKQKNSLDQILCHWWSRGCEEDPTEDKNR